MSGGRRPNEASSDVIFGRNDSPAHCDCKGHAGGLHISCERVRAMVVGFPFHSPRGGPSTAMRSALAV